MEPDDNPRLPPGAYVPCVELVEKVTAYLDGALPPGEMTEIEEHLTVCEACRSVLTQFRTVVDLAGRITPEDVDGLDATSREDLMAAFRRGPPRNRPN